MDNNPSNNHKPENGAVPGSTEWLAVRRITYDPTGAGRARYTHEPTGRAVIWQPHMTKEQWETAKIEFGMAAEQAGLD